MKKGQLLFELYSPTLVYAQDEFLSATRIGYSLLLKASRDLLVALGVYTSVIARVEYDRSVRVRVRV